MAPDLFVVALTGGIGLLMIVLGCVMRTGRGAFLISGYNMIRDPEKYDEKAICRFTGNVIAVLGLLMPGMLLIYYAMWLFWVFMALFMGIAIGAAVYCFKGGAYSRFLKNKGDKPDRYPDL